MLCLSFSVYAYLCTQKTDYETKTEGHHEGAGHDEQGVCRTPVQETAVHKQRGARKNQRVTEDA